MEPLSQDIQRDSLESRQFILHRSAIASVPSKSRQTVAESPEAFGLPSKLSYLFIFLQGCAACASCSWFSLAGVNCIVDFVHSMPLVHKCPTRVAESQSMSICIKNRWNI